MYENRNRKYEGGEQEDDSHWHSEAKVEFISISFLLIYISVFSSDTSQSISADPVSQT